tara:strand:- start:3542 stop:4150 length:609 start_codon:yes stop_codon:yes gene_type:complete
MNYIIKAAIIGDYGVGKTSISNTFMNNTFYEIYTPTLGVDFRHKIITLKDNSYKIQIWDTAGQERFQSIVKSYLRDLDIAILVFDLSNPDTFLKIEEWYKVIKFYNKNKENINIFLIGNKNDISDRKITINEINKFIIRNNIKYYECSAKNNKLVKDIFISIVSNIDLQVRKEEIFLRTFSELETEIKIVNKKKISQCCIIS